jgi:hypothetical protein
MNIAAIIIYLFIAYLVTVHVGWKFYTNGKIYIMHLMQQDEQYSNAINKLLLTGYYLLNLGYSAVMITLWIPVYDLSTLISTVATMLSRIILTLGIMHFLNMSVIYLLSKKYHTILKK